MAATFERNPARPIHPVHAFLLAGAVSLFLAGLLSDLAYSSNYQIQWINFAAWLIAGGMLFTGLALLWALIDLIRSRPIARRPLVSFLLLLAIFVLGLINSFVHARDAWGTMPDGLILSAIVTLAAILAAWAGFASLDRGAAK